MRRALSSSARGRVSLSSLPTIVTTPAPCAVPSDSRPTTRFKALTAVSSRARSVRSTGPASGGARVSFQFRPARQGGTHELIAKALTAKPLGIPTDCVSDAEGNYTSPPLRAGAYTVSAEHEQYLPGEERTAQVRAPDTASGVNLVMRDGVSISGRVLDWDGKGFAGVRLEAEASDEKVRYAPYGWCSGRQVFTDDGTFVLRGLEKGEHRLIVSLDVDALCRTACSAPAQGFEIRVPAPPRIKGRVVDKLTGDPVEEFVVWSDKGRDRSGYTKEHPDGRFELICEPGECGVKVESAPGYAPAVVEGFRPIDGAKPEEILVELVRGTTLTFHVTSAEDGSAVAEAGVSWEDGYVENGTDAGGKCVAANIPAGRHEFEFNHPDFALKHVVVEIGGQEDEREINVVLDKGLTIGGRVVASEDGTPVPKALVMLTHADMLPMMYGEGWAYKSNNDPFDLCTWTDERGAFTIEHVTLEEYGLYVWHEGYVPFRKVMRFSEGSEEELLVEMTSDGRIVGTVTTADGDPVAEAEVRELGISLASCWTDAQGKYALSNVEPGTCRVQIETPRARITRSVLVREGEETRLDVVLGGAAIFGKVTREGKPEGGVQVCASPRPTSFASADGVSVRSKTDEEGVYRIDSLPPGDYGITFDWGSSWGLGGFGGAMGDDTEKEVRLGDQDLRLDIELGCSSVTGVVRMPNGDPASKTVVTLLPGADGGDRLAGLVRAYHMDAHTAWTDRDGAFHIEGVAPGLYHLIVAKEGYAIQVLPVEKREGKDVTDLAVTLARDATVLATVRLPEGASAEYVRLAIADEEGRLIREDQFVRVSPETGQCRVCGLASGRYTVVAWADVFAPCRQDITVAEDGTTEVELHFEKGRQLRVALTDDLDAAVPDAQVVLDPGGDPSLAVKLAQSGVTDEDGRTAFESVADGDYTLRVRREGYEDASVPVHVAGSDGEATVTLRPRGN
jgi:protocatechuate 3,4-dioxygenase beta subunit